MIKNTCSCNSKASYVCLENNLYLCEKCQKNQKGKSTHLDSFVKKTVWKKRDLQKSLKALKFEKKKNIEELMLVHNNMLRDLKKLKSSINDNLENMISIYDKKIKGIIDKEVNNNIKNLESKLNNMEKHNQFIKLSKFIDKMPYGKIRKDERQKIRKINSVINTDSVFNDLTEYLKVLDKQTNNITKGIDEITYKCIEDSPAARQASHSLITTALCKEAKYFKRKEEGQTMKEVLINSEVLKKDNKDSMEKTDDIPRRPIVRHNSVRRGTELIEGTLALKLKQMGEKMVSMKEVDGGIIEESDESEFDSESDMSMGSFENDEGEMEEFSSDEEDISDEIKEKFKESKEKFFKLVKKTVEDIGKEEFYDIKDKGKVNNYVKDFIADSDKESKILLLNFNRL